ncbi:hypothetical protein KSS87_013718 [Heliosperma pusillum]|nr:hypothetical protein KSS87_013718 [Heliosperma pusillum]
MANSYWVVRIIGLTWRILSDWRQLSRVTKEKRGRKSFLFEILLKVVFFNFSLKAAGQ